MSLTTAQISAQLDRVLASDPRALTVAIRAPARQPWAEALSQRGRQFSVRWCESTLAIREALCDIDVADPTQAGLVLITPLATNQIPEDIASRFARATVFQPGGWDMVRQLFQAKEIDARLGRYAWMPQLLIEGTAQGAYAPVANGFLDLDTAWRELLKRFLGFHEARPDGVALLTWSLEPRADVSLNLLQTAARADVIGWLGSAAGAVGSMVLACVESGRTADAVPIGLVCGVVFAAESEGVAELGQAAIRLERFVDGRHVGVPEGRGWSAAAEQLVRSAGQAFMRPFLDRADTLLKELRIAEFASISDLLPSSLDQRMRACAAALQAQVDLPSAAHLLDVERCSDRVMRHAVATLQPHRLERIEMSRRLARWLSSPVPQIGSATDALVWQSGDGAFLDWARFRLLGGDEMPELSDAYASIRRAIATRRDVIDRQFADALVRWNAESPRSLGRIVLLEEVLEGVLGPLAAQHPVLLLVMDGMSTSIHRELFSRIATLGWMEMVREDIGRAMVGVAALPTVTEVSRASLLCGRLTVGNSAQEKTGFSMHPALLAHSRADAPPRVFHKGDLADSTNLSTEVRSAMADAGQRVVCVVYNAVDDHLSGPDQLHQRWALEELRLFSPLLREAREARRVVVITADHGHLLEDGTRQITGGESDRWRVGREIDQPDEVALAGGRVISPDGSDGVVCLWGEGTRYVGRKNGYHGGVSPQEVAVPLSVIVPSDLRLPGWQPAPPSQPDWWDLPPLAPPDRMAQAEASSTPSRPVARKALPGQSDMFSAPPEIRDAPSEDWIARLLASPVYASQRQLAARVAVADDKMRLLLAALDERGGKLSRAALAQRLTLPEIRLGGFLSAVRRVLNVDQALVLAVDDSAGTVELNRALLDEQFRLGRTEVQR